ncbi:MAG: amino acid ABC transporter substrate-binding protein [Lachnospiraceae bacterium]|nr:amino acid ABC transporter substrate-binding protein [Lachnospiraceae bacterium]
MKKQITAAMLAGVMAFSLAACGGSSTATTTAAPADTTAAEASAEDTKAEDTTAAESSQEASEAASGEKKTFIVGFDQDFPPMGFVGDDGEYTGFDLELAAEVAERLGMEFVPQPIAWDAKDMELESGTIDCIWNGFTITGREDGYTWSEPYMDNSQVFVVAGDSGISTLADLAGKIVEVQTDSSAEAALKEDAELTGSFGQLLTVADYNTAFMDLEQGAVDAIAMDVIVAGYQIEQRNADFVMLDESLASEEYGVGFKKGNEELRDQVQAALEEMAADGTLTEISEKWFGKDVTTIGK